MFLDDGLGATPEKRTPSFSWIAAISIIVGFVYPFVAVLGDTGPLRGHL